MLSRGINSMERILKIRDEIYNCFDGSSFWKQLLFKGENDDRYAAYYTSMYLIQDCGEAVLVHHQREFSSDPLSAYIEFWGVVQAIYIQQDAIKELYLAIKEEKMEGNEDWKKIRDFRNRCVGHPSASEREKKIKTFMGRHFGTYDAIKVETYYPTGNDLKDSGGFLEKVNHDTYNLSNMINAYDVEASEHLTRILEYMQSSDEE